MEVGAGRGDLAEMLRTAGYALLAIDPASDAPGVLRVPLLDLAEPAASFDAAVAVVSMHHVEPLSESVRHLAELMRPGGTLVVDEFDVERLDEVAAAWWLAHHEDEGHRREPAELVAEMRAHLHSLDTIRDALGDWFELEETMRGPYLYRWHLPPGLRPAEEAAIDAGTLPATGARVVGHRRSP